MDYSSIYINYMCISITEAKNVLNRGVLYDTSTTQKKKGHSSGYSC